VTIPQRLGLIAPALVVAASLVVVAAKKGSRRADPAAGRPRVQRSRSTASEAVALIDRRDAVAVARRFASAYAGWDAGERDAGVRRRLRATATDQLIASLPREPARPVAQHPSALRLSAAGAYRLTGGSYAVPLVLDGRSSFHVVTLIVVPTPSGARVTRLEQ
jgi:hypothetical protein